MEICITKEGKPPLGAALGTSSYITEFVKAKVKNWSLELEQLASIANTQPHATFSALTHGLASRWVYVARTIPNIGHLLQPLEELLRTKCIPSLTGHAAPSDLRSEGAAWPVSEGINLVERELLALPARLGGLGVLNPSHLSTTEYSASMKVTQPLLDHIIKQDEKYGYEILQDQHSAKAIVHKSKREQHSNAASTLKDVLPPSLAHAMDLSHEKGDNNNKLRDVVLQTCHRACISAKAEAGSGLGHELRNTRPADILASNWLCGKPAAFDLTVVSPLNPTFISEAGRTAGSAAVAAELRKHSANDAKCSELGWTCIPLVAESYGAWGSEAVQAFSRLASYLATRTNSPKSKVVCSLYSRLNLTLVRANARAFLLRCGCSLQEGDISSS
ncbi:hypothetical protein EMCRGX_G031881 [Ephydatia muelleri]